jgi:membrane protease YdiL (CAAX protease family)
MVIVALILAGAISVPVAWMMVVTGRVSIWPAMSGTLGALGLAALLTGEVSLSPEVDWRVSAAVGLGTGIALYLGTAVFVLTIRRWPRFDRHVREIYGQRKGLGLLPALLLAAGVNAPGEELFWRGLMQARLARAVGWPGSTAATWAAYVVANLASRNLPIVAGAVVGGAVWGALAWWTYGVLASLLCHCVWTGMMLAFPPGGPRAQPTIRRGASAS